MPKYADLLAGDGRASLEGLGEEVWNGQERQIGTEPRPLLDFAFAASSRGRIRGSTSVYRWARSASSS